MKLFTTDTIRAWDLATIETGVSPIELMEKAAEQVTEAITFLLNTEDRVAVVAGIGNNGGDAMAVARLLSDRGFKNVETFLLLPIGHSLSEDAEINATRLVNFVHMKSEDELLSSVEFDSYDLLIDGLFGSGLSRPLEGIWQECVNRMNASDTPIVSIDIPSGAFADEVWENELTIIRADLVLSLQQPKRIFLFPESQQFMDDFLLLDIGLDPTFHEEQDCDWYYLQEEDVHLPERLKFSHKGTFGKALLISGHRGMYGAAQLSGGACLRSGVGSLVIHSATEAMPILQSRLPEAMFSPSSTMDHISDIPDLQSYSAVGCGPGLGRHRATIAAVDVLLEKVSCPLVLDADALNIIAEQGWIERLPKETIITPHPKEFERLFGPLTNSMATIETQRAKAISLGIIILLKGAHTSIALPDGRLYFNSTGNPHMATAGMGDVLTGLILGLLSQGMGPEDAALSGAFFHGRAGDNALAHRAGAGLLSRDVVNELLIDR